MRAVANMFAVKVPNGNEGMRGLSVIARIWRVRAPGKANSKAEVACGRKVCDNMK